tara:strand:- start:73 stop:822 length:750 start_codon:yes stop_codon:yes gene_type:complete
MSIKLKDNIQNELNGGCESLAGECYFERLRTDSANLHGGKKQKGGSGMKAMHKVGEVDSVANDDINNNLKNILELGGQAEADAAFDGCVGSSSPECVSAISGGGSRKNKKNIYQKMNIMNKMKKTLRRKGGSSPNDYLSLKMPSPVSGDLVVPIEISPVTGKRKYGVEDGFAKIRSHSKNSPPTFDPKWLLFDKTAMKSHKKATPKSNTPKSNKKTKRGGKGKKTIRKSRKDKTKKAKKSRKSRKSNRK